MNDQRGELVLVQEEQRQELQGQGQEAPEEEREQELQEYAQEVPEEEREQGEQK
jgi:hypothetical protein